MRLVDFLRMSSAMICERHGCAPPAHHCDAFAFISGTMELLDLCPFDLFPGSQVPYAVIPLPWTTTQCELEEEVAAQCAAWHPPSA